MESDGRSGRGRRRLAPFVLVAAGVGLVLYLGSKAPKEQHVRLSLGPHAAEVTGLDVAYLGSTDDTEATRTTRLSYELGKAPRMVALDPELPSGDYVLRVEIAVQTASGREKRTVDRRIRLEGGTTSVDLAGILDENRSAP